MEPVAATHSLLGRVRSLSRHFSEKKEDRVSDSAGRVDAPWTTGIMRDRWEQGTLTCGS